MKVVTSQYRNHYTSNDLHYMKRNVHDSKSAGKKLPHHCQPVVTSVTVAVSFLSNFDDNEDVHDVDPVVPVSA